MPELPHQLIAALTGFIAGILLCIPVGPVNITILNEGARHGLPQCRRSLDSAELSRVLLLIEPIVFRALA